MAASVIKVPRNETPWVIIQSTTGDAKYVITSKPLRDVYYIYSVSEDGSLTKLGKGDPGEMMEKYLHSVS